MTEVGLIQVLLRNTRKQDSTGGDPLGRLRCEQEHLAEVDVEDALARDHVHDKAIHDPSEQRVGIEAMGVLLDVEVAVGDHLELGLAVAARGVEREEDGPCEAHAHGADDGADAEVAEEEIGVEALMLEGVGVGDAPEDGDPAEPGVW